MKAMKIGVLWFPAWASTEDDLQEMIHYLKQYSIEYHSINLKGHNTKPADLHGVTYKDWLQQAEEAYVEVSQKWDYIFVGGLSMGGQLALYLASKYKVDGVITIGTPLRIKIPFVLRYLSHLLQYIPYRIHRKNPLLDERVRTIALSRKGAYRYFPISSVAQVCFLTRKIRRKYIRHISSPILLIQSTKDHVVPTYNLDIFQKKLKTPSQNIHIMWVKDAYHLVNLDKDKQTVFNVIYEFIKKYSIIQEYK
jgi:carboxylesterase